MKSGSWIRGSKVFSHDETETEKLGGGIVVCRIEREHKLAVYRSGSDEGYHEYGTQWWTNHKCPVAFRYLNLDDLYATQYFDQDGHPSEWIASELYEYMQETYASLFGRRFSSVLELGSGGGEITHQFLKNGLDYVTVEGTIGGVSKLERLGIPKERILHENLKFLRRIDRSFDLVVCTEVAEHIEPWFASKIVDNCVSHGHAVWFSSSQGTARPHYHHMNEAPIGAWDNIFAQFGFDRHAKLNGTASRADRLYMDSVAYEEARLISLLGSQIPDGQNLPGEGEPR